MIIAEAVCQGKFDRKSLKRETNLQLRHNFLAAEIRKSLCPPKRLHHLEQLHYPRLPYPPEVVEIISSFPSGKQAIAYQYHGISLELMMAWTRHGAWSDQLVSSLGLRTKTHTIQPSGPFVDLLRKLWAIMERLDPEEASFERFMCITQYMAVIRLTYVTIVHRSSFFRALRADASEFIYQFQPRTRGEFECFVYYSMYVINSWKTEGKLEEGGLRVLRSMKQRFPEMRRWESILDIVQRFLVMPPYIAEWKNDWLQSASSHNDNITKEA
jgi:hypothetical protein